MQVLVNMRRSLSVTAIDFFIFLYFLTLSGELLNLTVGLFKPRLNHVLAVLLLLFVIKKNKKICFDKALLLPSQFLLFSLLLSTVLGEHFFRSLGYLAVFGFSFICYFLLPYNLLLLFDKERVLKIYWASFLTLGVYAIMQVLFSIKGIVLPFVYQYAKTVARGQGWNYEPSFYALYMTAFVMFYNARELFQVDKKINWLRFMLINLFLISSTSTGIIFSYPVFTLLYFLTTYLNLTKEYVKKVKRRTLQMLGFFFASMSSIWLLFPQEFIVTFYKFFDLGFTRHWSIVERWRGVVKCFLVFKENPFFGVGVGGVGPYLFRSMQQENVATTLKEMEKYDPTNVFSEVLASLGIVGMLSFCFLMYKYWGVFKSVMQKSLNISLQDRRTAIAMMISLICILVVMQFNQGLFRSYIWVHAAITLSYLRSLQRGSVL